MEYKIVGDSCFDTNREIQESLSPQIVPLTIQVGDVSIRDDENLDTLELIKIIKESPKAPKTASPSPLDYVKAYEGAQGVFAVTLSSKLSSSYSSAQLAKEMALENDNDKFIHVFDSKSATIAETLIGLKIKELLDQNLEGGEIVQRVEQYIGGMKTLFILESLDTLIKAGRISRIAGIIGTALSIKPIMGADEHGNIYLVEKARGSKKAFKRLVELIGESAVNMEGKIIGISHVNCLEKAESLKVQMQENFSFKDVVIVEGKGITTVYAGEGGIVVAF
ncbi:EDD domain protein, DegV family [Peptoclostridium litorale DSM 5388]|uniref:DegV domain-containing protein n=1 Tax=Peptoclostridium litorale DSM 5388 TaxID=1121324 RepID=A0A069RPT3_PEPLI|nr:DegV family protein [Peptoclostridium litorale]KDR96177.1 DegV domain-containing protein [Peptoclostridium litorale DSM 5388]SIO13001.1 EDD domain protein, DegV family [Peptoclostridium litorale DSM 5388]